MHCAALYVDTIRHRMQITRLEEWDCWKSLAHQHEELCMQLWSTNYEDKRTNHACLWYNLDSTYDQETLKCYIDSMEKKEGILKVG